MSAKKLRVLMAEGSPSGAVQTLREIFPEPENDLELTVVSTVATLLSTIKIADPEIILLDLALSLRSPYDANARYLQKPYSPTTLGRIVREILDQTEAKKTAS